MIMMDDNIVTKISNRYDDDLEQTTLATTAAEQNYVNKDFRRQLKRQLNLEIDADISDDLFISLKFHIDSQQKLNQLNQSRIRSFERFRKYCQRLTLLEGVGGGSASIILEQFQNEYNKFDQNYRYFRKKIRKLRKQTKSLSSSSLSNHQNPYDTLYDLFSKIENFNRSRISNDIDTKKQLKQEDHYNSDDQIYPEISINVIESSSLNNNNISNVSINNHRTQDKSIQCDINNDLSESKDLLERFTEHSGDSIAKTKPKRGRPPGIKKSAITKAKKSATTAFSRKSNKKAQSSTKKTSTKIKKNVTSSTPPPPPLPKKSLPKRKAVLVTSIIDSDSTDFPIDDDEDDVAPVPEKKKAKRGRKKQSSDTPKVIQCEVDGCRYSTTNSWNMNLHKRTHSNDRPFKCDKCNVAFKIKGDLKVHQNIHEGRRFECTFEGCMVSYATRKGILKHIKIFHTKEAPLIHCNWDGCNYTTYRSEYLKIHRKVHTGERPFKCVWPDCGQAFKSSSNLWSHKMKHQNESRFKCSFAGCNYITYTNEYLQNHQVVHTGEKPYKCVWPKCGHAFKTLSSLNSHKMIHENERRYKCSFVGCEFLDNLLVNLQRHEETKHGKKNVTQNNNITIKAGNHHSLPNLSTSSNPGISESAPNSREMQPSCIVPGGGGGGGLGNDNNSNNHSTNAQL